MFKWTSESRKIIIRNIDVYLCTNSNNECCVDENYIIYIFFLVSIVDMFFFTRESYFVFEL